MLDFIFLFRNILLQYILFYSHKKVSHIVLEQHKGEQIMTEYYFFHHFYNIFDNSPHLTYHSFL